MGQVGVHGLTGLTVGRYVLSSSVQNPTERRALLYGFQLGNLIPDLDFIAVVAMYPRDHSLAMHLHRGFSHSILGALALLVGFYSIAVLMKDQYVRYFGYGLALGVFAHFSLDIFIWFSPVDVFWPASIFHLIPPVDLWSWYIAPPLVSRLLGAGEFAAFGLYYDYLVLLAVTHQTDGDFLPHVRRFSTFCWLVFAVLTALAFDLPNPTFELYLYVPMGILFMPACFYITWRLQATIELLGVESPPLG